MMSRRGATITGVLAAGLTVAVGYAGAQVLVVGPSVPTGAGASAVAQANSQLGSVIGGPSRSVASSPVQQSTYSAPQATYTPAAPVVSSHSS